MTTADALLERFPMDDAAKEILLDVLCVMQQAEELGGPDTDSYFSLMQAIEAEAKERRGVARCVPRLCQQCSGTGGYPIAKCARCDGTGIEGRS